MKYTTFLALVIVTNVAANDAAFAESRVPIQDGAYLTADECDAAEIGELDGVAFAVEKNGREIGLLEGSCVVADVREVRDNRYVVTSDCLEFGEHWEYTFFLDALGPDNIAVDGDELSRCTKGFLSESQSGSGFGVEWESFLSAPEEQLCRFVTTRETHHYWWEDDSDDLADLVPIITTPAGVEILVYHHETPEDPAIGPDGIALVAEFKGYFVPLNDLKFIGQCGPSR